RASRSAGPWLGPVAGAGRDGGLHKRWRPAAVAARRARHFLRRARPIPRPGIHDSANHLAEARAGVCFAGSQVHAPPPRLLSPDFAPEDSLQVGETALVSPSCRPAGQRTTPPTDRPRPYILPAVGSHLTCRF